MALVAECREYLSANLPDWVESRINHDDVAKFPAWRVDFGGREERGAGWLTIVEVEVLAGHSGAIGNEESIEGHIDVALGALRNWNRARVSDIGPGETIALTNGLFYGVTLRLVATGPV